MTAGRLRPEVVAERTAWIRDMLAGIRSLPLDSLEAFEEDPRNVAAAESYLRRALEAQLDLGRHVLSKAFGRATAEYKQIAEELVEVGVLSEDTGVLLREMAGFATASRISSPFTSRSWTGCASGRRTGPEVC